MLPSWFYYKFRNIFIYYNYRSGSPPSDALGTENTRRTVILFVCTFSDFIRIASYVGAYPLHPPLLFCFQFPIVCYMLASRSLNVPWMEVLCGPRGNTWSTRSSTPGICRLVLLTLVLGTRVGKLYSASTLVLFLSASCSWDGGSRASASTHTEWCNVTCCDLQYCPRQ